MSDYYPSAKARFTIRFEEYGVAALKGTAPTKSTPKLKGVKDERSALEVVEDPESPPGAKRFLLRTKGSAEPAKASSGTGARKSGDGLTHEILGVIPKTASWKQNGVRSADTLTLSIRWGDMPIDPRVIRSCTVKFYLGTVSQENFAQGDAGVSRAIYGGSREGLHIIPDAYLDANRRLRTNLRFEGWVDKYKMTWSDGEPVLDLECTDNTRMFIKQVRPPSLVFGMEKPIDEAVAEYLTHFPQMDGLTVEYQPAGARSDTVPPRLKTSLTGSSFVPNFGPPAGAGGATGGEQQNVWDYLTDICGSVAHTIRVDGTRLIIQRLSNLMGTGPVPRADDPYRGRHLPSGDFPNRAFVFGRNLSELSIDREFTRKEPKNIEVRSYDPHRKNLLVARFPETADRLTHSLPGDGKSENEWLVVHAPPGIRDVAVLKQVAEEAYNGFGRQELGVHVKTRDLASFGGDNEDPDLFDMRVGDAFELLVNRAIDEGTLSDTARQLSASDLNKRFLVESGFQPEFAEAYAKAFTNAGFQREYKTREMTVDWNIESGVTFDVSGVNYVVARVDRPSASTQADTAKAGQPSPKGPPLGEPPKNSGG